MTQDELDLDDMLVVCWLSPRQHGRESLRNAVQRLIDWHVSVALNPLVSSAAVALVKSGEEKERKRWESAMRGAYRKGYEAAEAGKTAGACPYEDKRKDCGRLTWSRAFRAAWHAGWDAARQADPLSAYYADRANSGLATLAQ